MLARSSCTTLKLDEEAAFEPFVYNLAAAASGAASLPSTMKPALDFSNGKLTQVAIVNGEDDEHTVEIDEKLVPHWVEAVSTPLVRPPVA